MKYQPSVIDDFESWEAYFNKKIVPMVDAENGIKAKYRGRFWAYFWTLSFFMSINVLIALFNNIMRNHPLNYEQLLLINCCAAFFVIWPIISYYRIPRHNIFDVFVQYYGQWKHLLDSQVQLVHSPIIPQHDFVTATHNLEGEYEGIKAQLRDTFYHKQRRFKKIVWRHKVSDGVILFLKFPAPFKEQILLFDKSGFYRNTKRPDMQNITGLIHVPAANYFHIFALDEVYARQLLCAEFFEQVLDMKAIFGAKHMYIEIAGDHIRVYFEGSRLYFDNYNIWSKQIDKNKFAQLHMEFTQTFLFIDMMKYLVKDD